MYFSANDHGERSTREFNGQLYTACRNIVGEVNGIVFARDGSRARPRMVAFWCAHEGRVKPMFGASDDERDAVTDYRLGADR